MSQLIVPVSCIMYLGKVSVLGVARHGTQTIQVYKLQLFVASLAFWQNNVICIPIRGGCTGEQPVVVRNSGHGVH